ncbi:MAG TPA: glycosyltransferase family 4 protein [Solirubrobacteraceae bacterium]|nr:glycosyltransferase family 4 protein [Solirubrobacteraceae bacterium]
MILFLHHRYRTLGGEERVVDDQQWLVRERLGEDAELLTRDSAALGAGRATAGLLAGGLEPEEVAAAVRRTRARVVHAHNLLPTLGWRALAAARDAGARVVLQLHNFRTVCAVGTCFTEGADCTRCHARDTRPGVRHVCRGSLTEAVVYAAGLALWQRRLLEQADTVVVPSAAALDRLRALGAPLGDDVRVVPHVVRTFAQGSSAARGEHALVASRLAPEKGVAVAARACATAGLPLVVAGDGPLAGELRGLATGAPVHFAGRVAPEDLAGLRARAAVAVVPSLSAETFGLAAAEAMAAGVPVVASAIGALNDLVDEPGLVPPGDAAALARTVERRWGDEEAGRAGLERVRELCAPEAVAARLARVYET